MAAVSATNPTTPAAAPDTVAVASKQGTGSAGDGPSFTDDLAKAAQKLQPVKDHGFSKVVAGPHEGQYVNRAQGNERNGQTFEIVRRAGRIFHVYGTGADRKVVELPSAAKTAAEKAAAKAEEQAATTTDTTPAAGTTDATGTTGVTDTSGITGTGTTSGTGATSGTTGTTGTTTAPAKTTGGAAAGQ
jgi:hypothetical protein